jgi:tripartite-type tricarboxylate transporter receptor subunit TctC
MSFTRLTCSTLLAAAVTIAIPNALGQNFPTKPIRFVVLFLPATGSDIVARALAPKLAASLGQQIVVDNRAGAGGIVGSEIVARAAPDGYTIMLAASSHAINASLFSKLPYDTRKDFAAVTQLTSGPLVLVVNPSLPASSVKDLIAYVKTRPGQLSYASAGTGTPTHLAGELLKTTSGIDMAHVPYKGGPPAMTDVVAGQVLLYFSVTAPALPFVKSGRLKALAITGKNRSPLFPDTPTMIESGMAGYDVDQWYGVLAPAATPGNIVAKLHSEFTKALQFPDVRERFISLGLEPVGSTPEQFDGYIKAEIVKFEKVIKASGARAD